MLDSPNVWYSNALEKLSPLRYHLDEVLNEVEAYNRWAKILGKPGVPEAKIKAARLAQEEAEQFFTKGN